MSVTVMTNSNFTMDLNRQLSGENRALHQKLDDARKEIAELKAERDEAVVDRDGAITMASKLWRRASAFVNLEVDDGTPPGIYNVQFRLLRDAVELAGEFLRS